MPSCCRELSSYLPVEPVSPPSIVDILVFIQPESYHCHCIVCPVRHVPSFTTTWNRNWTYHYSPLPTCLSTIPYHNSKRIRVALFDSSRLFYAGIFLVDIVFAHRCFVRFLGFPLLMRQAKIASVYFWDFPYPDQFNHVPRNRFASPQVVVNC